MRIVVAILFVIFLWSCKSTDQQSPIKKLDPSEFRDQIAQLGNEQLVDLRTPAEVNDGFIPQAQFIDFLNDDFESFITSLDKNKPIMVYCASGGRSGKASKILAKNGFNEIYDLKGGFSAWESQGLDIDIP